MNKPTIDKLIGLMSPATLASFIVDMEPETTAMTYYATAKALDALNSIVGDEEADRMLSREAV